MAVAGIGICIFLLSISSLSSAQFLEPEDELLDEQLDRLSLNELLAEKLGSGPDQVPDLVPIEAATKFSVQRDLEQSLGQVTGIAVSPANELLLFCRRDRPWKYDSFDSSSHYTGKELGPIRNDTIIVIDTSSGKKLRSFGGQRFYLPHGITVDLSGNIWVTDVALHQIFRFPAGETSTPDLVLGEAFVPGNDQYHFCKPTDVAISSSGVAYISDGYCNSRIVIVSPQGKVIGSIANGDLKIAHSVALIEKEDLICVADREGRRVACYTAGLNGSQAGKLVVDLRSQSLTRVYAIDRLGDILLAVNGPEASDDHPLVVAMDIPSERVIGKFAPESGFYEPHDIAVAADGSSFFVADIDQRANQKVYQFSLVG